MRALKSTLIKGAPQFCKNEKRRKVKKSTDKKRNKIDNSFNQKYEASVTVLLSALKWICEQHLKNRGETHEVNQTFGVPSMACTIFGIHHYQFRFPVPTWFAAEVLDPPKWERNKTSDRWGGEHPLCLPSIISQYHPEICSHRLTCFAIRCILALLHLLYFVLRPMNWRLNAIAPSAHYFSG